MNVTALCSSSATRSLFTVTLFSLGVILASLTGCGGGDTSGDAIATPPGSGGGGSANPSASVSLAWDPVPDPSVYAYFVHYGKHPTGQPGNCNYPFSTFVGSPSATVTGLDPDTHYFFAVSAYNGLESACSNEVSTVTESAA
jgi:hypothetical protein